MAYTSKIRLSNFNSLNEYSRISFLKVFADDTECTIESISSDIIGNIADVIIDNNTEIVIPKSIHNYIEIEFTASIYVERFIYVQLRTHSQEKYWLQTFDIYYDHNDTDDWRKYMTAGLYIYPGADTLTSLPSFSAGALAKTIKWSNVLGTVNGAVSELETDVLINHNTTATSWLAQTNLATNEGKWCIEIYTTKNTAPLVFDFFLEETRVSTAYNFPLYVPAYRSIGVFSVQNSLWYNNGVSWGDRTANHTTLLPDYNGTTLAEFRKNFFISYSSDVRYGIQLLIDFDNKHLFFRNIITGNKIGYQFTEFSSLLNLVIGQRNYGPDLSGSYTNKNNRPRINLGYQPFIGDIPTGYTQGFGVETSVIVDAWGSLYSSEIKPPKDVSVIRGIVSPNVPRCVGMDTPDFTNINLDTKPSNLIGGNIPPDFIDFDNIQFVDPGPSQIKRISIDPQAEEDINDTYFAVDWVKYDPPRGTITRYGEHSTTGYGYIKSSVKKIMGSAVPIKTKVSLLDITNYKFIGFTFSDPVTGEFEFKHIPENLMYNVLAYDPNLGWVTGIGGPWQAQRMPEYEGLVFDNWFKP